MKRNTFIKTLSIVSLGELFIPSLFKDSIFANSKEDINKIKQNLENMLFFDKNSATMKLDSSSSCSWKLLFDNMNINNLNENNKKWLIEYEKSLTNIKDNFELHRNNLVQYLKKGSHIYSNNGNKYFELPGINVSAVDLANLKNSVVSIGSSWCSPCISLLNDLLEFKKRNNEDFSVYSVKLDKDAVNNKCIGYEKYKTQKLQSVAWNVYGRMCDLSLFPSVYAISKNGYDKIIKKEQIVDFFNNKNFRTELFNKKY